VTIEMIKLGAFLMAMAFGVAATLSRPVSARLGHKGASGFHFVSLILAAVAWAGFAAFAWLPNAFLGHNEYGALIRIDLVLIFLVLLCTTVVGFVSVVYILLAHRKQIRGEGQTG